MPNSHVLANFFGDFPTQVLEPSVEGGGARLQEP